MDYSFKPLINRNSKILILGTIPGQISIKKGQYYANTKNQFWDIIYSIYNTTIHDRYEDRCDFLLRNKIGLWDILAHANRKGSSDNTIKNESPNDILGLLEYYPNIETFIFNGSKAEKLFKKHFSEISEKINCVRVSSSSPTPRRYVKSLEEKKIEWAKAINNNI